MPFVLLSQPTVLEASSSRLMQQSSKTAHERYSQIMQDVEELIADHRRQLSLPASQVFASKLKLLVPSVGTFFTSLPLRAAFEYQDSRRHISSRRFVAPSFNDIRVILNTAQVMSLVSSGGVKLMTFDGDVTLYDDGQSLTDDNPVIPRLLGLLAQDVRIGIVTAAGYTEAERYYARLHGLLDAIAASELRPDQKQNLIVMGGESNFLFQYDDSATEKLRYHRRREWILDEMREWTTGVIADLLDLAESALRDCIASMGLEAELVRKERAVGIVPQQGRKLTREQLEETVLVCQRILVRHSPLSLSDLLTEQKHRNSHRPASVSPSAPSTAATTSSSTSATRPGACWPVRSSSAASRAGTRCTSETNSSASGPTTSRRGWRAPRRGSPTRPRRSRCWTRWPS